MKDNRPSLPHRFIPLQGFHIAPLSDVTPAAIKSAARQSVEEFKDRETLELNTALNFLAKRMGFRGGYGGYKEQYENLRRFMQDHGLVKRYDLITPRFRVPIVSLKPRQVADRLFLSGKPFPKRIFTGYDFDWSSMNDRWFSLNNPWNEAPESEHGYLPFHLVMRRCQQEKDHEAQMLEAAVEFCRGRIDLAMANLLGDLLLFTVRDNRLAPDAIVAKLYRQHTLSEEDFER